MFTLPTLPTRNDVLDFLSRSASYGNLGAFIGAGFSKAVLNDDIEEIALSWRDLLEQASKKLSVNYKEIGKEGVSYPDIASAICKVHSETTGCEYGQSLVQLKSKISTLTSWYPNQTKREKFSKYLEVLSPSWIITTNYDLVIESLLTGKSAPLGPNDALSSRRGVIPVFHLHGIRTNPQEIIIAQEDFVALFRPNQYRQIKLALTIKESTTLLLGYGLGDVNVLTALDWSRNVFKSEQVNYPHDVIQILRTKEPRKEPYRDRNSIVILETADLSNFFDEFIAVRSKLLTSEGEEQAKLQKLAVKLDDADDGMIKKFIDDQKYRKQVLKVLSKFEMHLIAGFLSFLNKCIDETWERSAPNGNFEGYNQNLQIILDILTSFPQDRFPPALFQTVAYGLERVGYYVGEERGKSRSAYRTWVRRKTDLTSEMVKELKSFAEQHRYGDLCKLVNGI
ncbi:SIR2-like domain-containing protein [Nitrosospira multiformis]|uniref:SIR2-like domain-containing protein n=1 Tax=Nitrosospira multiformis TaxID=1231 RepID=A0A1H9YEW6_9PROT|nr:SIR2 family protein [Nitrosospira multiformis]SES67101.1 SIR2-like domain-containing protein [Nitrosospira multiformis]